MPEHIAAEPTPRGRLARPARWLGFVVLALGPVAGIAPVRAQDGEGPPLSLRGVTPVGVRSSITESAGTLQFTITNSSTIGRDARVVVYYPERPDVQYARDVWIPARSALTTWLSIGPAPAQKSIMSREYQMVLIDRTGGKDKIVLPPGDERVRSRAAFYRRREPATALMVDSERADPGQLDPEVPPDLMTFVRLPRAVATISESVAIVFDGPLPLAPEAFDGIDVFVLTGNRLAADPPGRAALRRWVEQGGRLWVMLDRIDPDVIAPLLGDGGEVAIVDRVGLTTVRLRMTSVTAPELVRDLEQPVPFVRVLPAASDRVIVSTDGWPTAFVRKVGRGKILFTTLGVDGWARPRGPRDGGSPFPELVTFPVPLEPVGLLSNELHPPAEPDAFPPDVFQPMLADEIGYSIVSRGTAAGILGGFVVAILGIGLVLRRARQPILVGALLPLAALGAAGAFVVIGERSRRSVPPTIGIAAMVEPIAGRDECALTGLFALYHPNSGPVTLGSRQGATIGLDAEGLDGQVRTRVQTDTDAWHWDGLSLPAGARTGSLKTNLKTGRVEATARFGPKGIEGKLDAGMFTGLDDALVSTRARDALTTRIGADGTFTCGSADALVSGEYLSGTVLSDRQQRRQVVYRHLHTGTALKHHDGRDLLMVWANPPEIPVVRQEGARLVGGVLLAVPIDFERSPPNTLVTVPRGIAPYRRMFDGKQIPVLKTGASPADMRLRFQLPPSVLPLRVEKATVYIQVRSPFRQLTVAGVRDGHDGPSVSQFQVLAPVDPVRVEITDATLLRLDEQGGLYLNIALSGPIGDSANDMDWKIESLSLEVTGRTE